MRKDEFTTLLSIVGLIVLCIMAWLEFLHALELAAW